MLIQNWPQSNGQSNNLSYLVYLSYLTKSPCVHVTALK